MSKRDGKLLLEDILESINKVDNYIKNLTFEEFANNDLVFDATVRNLQIIGEAVSNIPDTIKNNLRKFHGKEFEDYAIESFTNTLALILASFGLS